MPAEHERKPVRIEGPAHRRADRRPNLLMATRRVWGWGLLVAALLIISLQWVAGGSHPKQASEDDGVGVPAPPPVPSISTGSAPSPTASPSRTARPKPARTTAPAPVLSPARRAGPATARITSPSDGTNIQGGPGVLMEGTARDLGRHRLRVFDYAPNGVYYLTDDGPVGVSGGRWSFRDGTIGAGAQDVGKDFLLVVALADPACENTLRHATPDGQNNVGFAHLPPGCQEADSVRVHKIAP